MNQNSADDWLFATPGTETGKRVRSFAASGVHRMIRRARESSGSAERVLVPVRRIAVSAYTIPTDAPESDGTLRWDSTTLVLVEAEAGGMRGIGYSYTPPAAARLIEGLLAPVVTEG